jgi:hypothetical protein
VSQRRGENVDLPRHDARASRFIDRRAIQCYALEEAALLLVSAFVCPKWQRFIAEPVFEAPCYFYD